MMWNTEVFCIYSFAILLQNVPVNSVGISEQMETNTEVQGKTVNFNTFYLEILLGCIFRLMYRTVIGRNYAKWRCHWKIPDLFYNMYMIVLKSQLA